MADLSPAAQAVLNAFNAEAKPEPHHQREAIAAAIRALADRVVPLELVLPEQAPIDGHTRQDQRSKTRRELLALADELEGLNG
jgi:uncharacterized protein YjiS (DUF1127 family)